MSGVHSRVDSSKAETLMEGVVHTGRGAGLERAEIGVSVSYSSKAVKRKLSDGFEEKDSKVIGI